MLVKVVLHVYIPLYKSHCLHNYSVKNYYQFYLCRKTDFPSVIRVSN